MRLRMAVAALFITALACLPAGAVSTQRWDLATFEQWSKGESESVEIGSAGELRAVRALKSEKVSADGVWSIAVAGRGKVYLGTGNSAKLMLYDHGKIRQVAAVDAMAITRIRIDRRGRVWFSAIPGGVIYRLGNEGKVVTVADTGEEYLWDFILDGGDVIAATGSRGKIIRLSEAGKVKDVIKTGDQHVMCLLRAGNGKLYAGTSGEGLVLEIPAAGKFRVVRDFKEKEVKALAWAGSGKNGSLIAAANKEAGARLPSRRRPSAWSRKEVKEDKAAGDDKGGEQGKAGAPPPLVVEPPSPPRGGGKVNGAVYELTDAGGARRLLNLRNRAAVDLAAVGKDVYVATDQEGKVYRCRPGSTDYAVSFDLQPSQVLALAATPKELVWMGTGAPATLVSAKSRITEKAAYISKVFDARFPARWGAIDWKADGPLRILTRSGNISNPDTGWSQWKPVALGKPAAVNSPGARFLQVKIEWLPGSRAVLKSLTIPYRIYNQPQYVDAVKVETADQDGNGNANKPRVRVIKSGAKDSNPPPHQSRRTIAWKVTNPDHDHLVFLLYFQPEGTDKWIPVNAGKPVSKNKFKWETASLADGWYRIKVAASDAPSNPPEDAIETIGVSERFLIDNRPPEIKALLLKRGKASGTVHDSASAVSGIQYSIDGGEWSNVAAADGVLDAPEESFKFDLPAKVKPGLHVLAVRAWDRAMNLGVAQKQFEQQPESK